MTFAIEPGLVYGLTLGRGGSAGLPGKNIRPLGGHPLIAWSVAAGAAATSVSRIICSTDDQEIAEAAQQAGAEVPFMRPAELATSGATDLDVFTHFVNWLAEYDGRLPELMVQLRPTTPFRQVEWIEHSIERMLADQRITCIRSIAPAPHTPYKMWTADRHPRLSPLLALPGIAEPYNLPRQALPVVYWHTGQIDIIRTETILSGSMTGDRIEGVEVPSSSAVDVDHLIDFQLAEICFSAEMPQDLIDFLASP